MITVKTDNILQSVISEHPFTFLHVEVNLELMAGEIDTFVQERYKNWLWSLQ